MRRFIGLPVVLATALLAGGAAAQAPVKIGVLNDQSGLYADLTGMGSVNAARMAVEDFGGKVAGRPIEVIFADHQNKADLGASIARQWIENDHVNAILDIPNSAVGLAVQEVARARDAVAINTGAASSDLTGKSCSPHGIHWTFDTYALAAGTGKALVKQGLDTWFFITADYAFGHALERDTAAFVEAGGGKVLGAVRHPLSTPDFSSFLLQAQGSKAKVIGLANAGGDTINSVKQAAEFGITKGGQSIAGLLVQFPDVHALGLQTAQGIVMTASFDWSLTDKTREWTKRFLAVNGGKPPSMIHAGTYGGVLHYLKAVAAANSTNADAVVAKMKAIPIDDFYTKAAHIREDGRVMREYYLLQVKAPAESNGPLDYTKLLATIPPDQAARPLAEGNCPMLKKS